MAVNFNFNDNMTLPDINIPYRFEFITSGFSRSGRYLYIASMTVGLFMVFLISSCRTAQPYVASSDRQMTKNFNRLGLAAEHHTGLSVYDLNKGKWIFRYRDDNFFTPASNIKILTLYTALQVLEDSLIAAWYTKSGDTLIVWGGGDPGTLYPDIVSHHPLVDFLKARNETIIFSNAHFQAPRYGRGWAWDDYRFAFQCERNAIPVYGNRLWLDRKGDAIHVTPHYLIPLITVSTDTVTRAGKTEWGDSYYYRYNPKVSWDHQQIPITFFKHDLRMCWNNATGKEILLLDRERGEMCEVVKGSPRDSLLKVMMRESDNFIADQLLLACSMKGLGVMSEEKWIDTLLKTQLKEVAGDLRWVDGSGLSRYNLATPRSMVWVLQKIIRQKGMAYIQAVFPAGGQSGTIRDWYRGPWDQPYVFAKTGSMRHTHTLSGYLVTRSGKTLVFSWMHNQYPGDVRDIKTAMNTFFSFLYEHY